MSAELLAPAGNFQTALAAFEAGADAVYCGLSEFSARAFADNFSPEDLKSLLRFARARGKKVYVTFNTLIDEDNIESAVEQLALLDVIRPDALIVQDIGIARLCRKYFPDLELHASTQLVAHNLEGVLAMKELGFSRVVLARELSLGEIVSIARRCGIELECFIHGALCYSISGLCLFGAMEKGRSGNRGRCPYCCRLPYETEDGRKTLAFSMKDLRLSEDVLKLVEAGVSSLKIEGRMKNEIYVASVTRYYRQILDARRGLTVSDLETVFSRRTTKLYFDAAQVDGSPIDPDSLGHLGAEIGLVKRVTKDRDGLSWLRFHTLRALEKHDGLQFANPEGGKPLGMGIVEMRQAISRRPVFEVAAGTDVEILLPKDETNPGLEKSLRAGMKVYCSASQAVRRMFPPVGFRPSDYAGDIPLFVEVTLAPSQISVTCGAVKLSSPCTLQAAKSPEKTFAAVEKAFSKLGDTDYRLDRLTVNDPERLFAPMSVLNDLRRDLVERLDETRHAARRAKIEAALADAVVVPSSPVAVRQTLKIRPDQKIPSGSWNEIILAVNPSIPAEQIRAVLTATEAPVRLALPVYTAEPAFNKLRVMAKSWLREGLDRWEVSDLATFRMLKTLGVTDISADWTLYAFNQSALCQLTELGVRRFVASPENERDNLQFLAESGYDIEFLKQQSTPLFVSLTKPAAFPRELACTKRDGLWVTTRPLPRTFDVPDGASVRIDLSWDPVLS